MTIRYPADFRRWLAKDYDEETVELFDAAYVIKHTDPGAGTPF